MKYVISAILLAMMAFASIGCHAGGHVDDTGVGAHVEPNH